MKQIAIGIALGLLAATQIAAAKQEVASSFSACLAELQETAARSGVEPEFFFRITRTLQPDPKVLELLERQPEFITPIWDYLAMLVQETRIAEAAAQLAAHKPLLKQIELDYGVEAELLVAFWAIESNFGRNLGRFDLLRSLATLACLSRRSTYFRQEFIALLQILKAGELKPLTARGSWAGAFGQTQFMPSTFLRYAVDGDGDGRKDLFNSYADIFASTANYLKQSGWRYQEPWGIEVSLPLSWQSVAVGRTEKRPTHEWLAMGIQPLVQSSKPFPARAALLLPAGKEGPALLVFPNYDVIFRYNGAESYALAVALLFDLLKNPAKAKHFDPASPFITPWPLKGQQLSRSEIVALQQHLVELGFDPGGVDGVLGPATREAIRRYQLECLRDARADGWPDAVTIKALQAGTCAKAR